MMSSDPDFSDVKSGSSTTSPAAPVANAPDTYTVVSGDSLSKIAKKHYQDGNKWNVIYEANRDQLSDPDKIKPGQILKIPAL